MPTPLNLFPVRVPIGRFTDKTGASYDVLMTPEYARALSDLMVRVGGTSGFTMAELAMLAAAPADHGARVAALEKQVLQLSEELATANRTNARVAALEKVIESMARNTASDVGARVGKVEKSINELAHLVRSSGPAPVDWRNPGKIGAGSQNTGAFSALTASTYNKVTIVQPLNGAGIQISDQRTFKCTNNITLSGNDGTTLNILGGGTLGSAAFQNTSAFAGRSGTALAPAATDAATTQTLANSLRAVLISVGIGT